MYLETTEKIRIPYKKIPYPYLRMVGENLGKSPLKTFPQVGRTRPKESSPETDCSTGEWRAGAESLSSI